MTTPTTRPCVTCRTGLMRPGTTTITKRRDDAVMVVHHVPAEVCDNCSDALLDEDVVGELEQMFAAALAVGSKYAVRDFAPKVA